MSGDPPREPWRRPAWWPENEEWPPPRWRHGPWSGSMWGPGFRARRGFRRPFGCLIVAFLVFATGTFTLAIWALAALAGFVAAPRGVVVLGILALLLVAFVAMRAFRALQRSVAPIDDLVDAAESIEAGDYTVRVSERGTPQMRSLARAFNGMSARLADLDTRRRTFLADVAHELRTPLSVIAGQLEGIEDGLYPADSEHLGPIQEHVRVLDKLIDDLRTVALAEAGSLSLERRPTDIGALADEVVGAFGGQPATAGIKIRADAEPGLPPVNVDSARIRQVMANLLSNALRHISANGGEVTIRVRGDRAAGGVTVEVIDNGTGIPAELLPTVFERFVKDPSSPGSGLGLAIARDLVVAHGGTIEALSEPGKGTNIRATLPT